MIQCEPCESCPVQVVVRPADAAHPGPWMAEPWLTSTTRGGPQHLTYTEHTRARCGMFRGDRG